MRSAFLALGLLALGACGGSTTGAASPEAPGCAFGDAPTREARSAGSRIVVSLPEGFARKRGLLVYAHPCGAAVMLAEAPPSLDAEQRTAFAAGVLLGALETAGERGMTCTEVEPMARWTCEGGGPESQVARLVQTEAGPVAALARGPLSTEALGALVADVRVEAEAAYDGLEATGLALEPLPGMRPSPLSFPGAIDFVGAEGTAPPAPLLAWRYVRYTADPAHRDGSPWEDGEIGATGGELAVTTLALESADESTMVVREIADGRLELTFDGTSGGEPVFVFLGTLRDEEGVFFALGRGPAAAASTLLVAYRSQVQSAE